jgi:hypothetical protein
MDSQRDDDGARRRMVTLSSDMDQILPENALRFWLLQPIRFPI